MDRQTYLEIDTDAFKYNVEQIKKLAQSKGKNIMPILKANAYGTYINKNINLIKDFEIIGLAMCSEAIEIRNEGYGSEIFILNEPYEEDISNIIKYNLIVGVSSPKFLDALGKSTEKVKIFIEIESGMGRTGVQEKNLDSFINKIKSYDNIEVVGIYTHFCVADGSSKEDEEFTNKQIEIFDESCQKIKSAFSNIKYISSEASDGLLKYDDKLSNITRPGLILYGYEPFKGTNDIIDLKPVTKLKSKISYIKEIDKNTSISYGRTFIADKKMKVATVGIGYADGLRRALSNKGEVLINGKRCKILGIVCMDSFMCDVTDVDCTVGDDVYIWDNENITLDEIANKCGTINYEIISCISNRVPRNFI